VYSPRHPFQGNIAHLALTMSLFLVIATLAESQTALSPSVPRLVMFNGVVKDASGKPLSGDVGVTFDLYREDEWWGRRNALNCTGSGD
jgi:hypothetical protein